MPKRPVVVARLIPWVLIVAAPFSYSQTAPKTKVASEADLPRHSYPLAGLASELLQSDKDQFGAFATKVGADVEAEMRDYDITDRSTLRGLLGAQLALKEVAGDFPGAVETVQALRALQDKPSPKLTTGLMHLALLKAAISSGGTSGPAYEEAFTANFRQEVNALPWEVVQDWARQAYASARLASRSSALAGVMTRVDPSVLKSHAVNGPDAQTLVQTRTYLDLLVPLAPLQADVLRQYIAAHKTTKPEIWSARDVTITPDQKLAPVLVAIWDTGIDVTLFPDQVFTDPNPTVSGTHGLAFDDHGDPSTSWLYPLTPEQQQAYPEVRDESMGYLDIREGNESPEAAALEKKVKTQTPAELHRFDELEEIVGPFMHGTHCAGIAVRGNAAGRLVVFRFNDSLPALTFPPTLEWARHFGPAFMQIADYCRTRNVRVVNMSWGDDREEFEAWLSKTGGGTDPEARKKMASALFQIWRDDVEAAIKAAPGTLFVVAAGNSDSNTGFTEDVPASFRLPNMIVVGALNAAGDETSFTSYGDSVAVYADGYDVESFVPGGARLKFSGTSMASPNVVNLAAKLIALNPALTPEQVVTLIKEGSSVSADGRRHLIDEKRSVELMKDQKG